MFVDEQADTGADHSRGIIHSIQDVSIQRSSSVGELMKIFGFAREIIFVQVYFNPDKFPVSLISAI